MKTFIKRFKSTLGMSLTNARGFRTNRKIIVIESDDWGSIRMPNKAIRDKFKNMGYPISDNPYCKYDTLASEEDLTKLFSILSKFKDENGNHPVITANTVVANPDFEAIKKSNYSKYSYKPFIETLKEYYPSDNVFKVWQQGIDNKVFVPQYHGREHLNVPVWMGLLQNDIKVFKDSFDLGFWGVPRNLYDKNVHNVQASYASAKKVDIEYYKETIKEGLTLFEDIFNYKSKTFIANNYTWSSELNQTLKDNVIIGLQGMKYQKTPTDKVSEVNLIPSYTGKRNEINQVYTVRNCIFEPSQMPKSFNNIKNCLKDIENSFFFKKPAIITSHRLNFIGAISPKNRDRNLNIFNELLTEILKKWPKVTFMSSDQLVDYLNSKKEF
jgi:hypothetical protein